MKTHLKPITKWFAASLITLGAGAFSSYALAATSAGQEIKNQANVTFEDQYGNMYQSTSNDAIVTVAQIYSATLIADRNTTASAGQTVYLPHTLTNTGNGLDTYTLNIQDDLPALDPRGPDTINTVPSTLELIHDEDGDGVAEPGEMVYSSGDTIGVPGGEQREFLIKAVIPTTALVTDTVGVTFTVTSANGAVIDENNNADNNNADLITVTNDAVLNTTKSATHLENITDEDTLGIDVDADAGNNLPVSLIRYTVTVTNMGNSIAKNVNIFDGIPEGTYVVDGTGTAYDLDSSGLLGVNGDIPIKAVPNLINESDLSHGVDLDGDNPSTETSEGSIASGLDLNQNGTTTDTDVPGVVAVDSQLAPGATISMTFYVAYSPTVVPGGTFVNNKAYVCASLNGDNDFTDPGECNDATPGATPTPSMSNETTTETTTTTGVLLSDTGPQTGASGGGDADNLVNAFQVVASSPAGADVFFYNIVTNTGNTEDSFDLSTVNTDFPLGTTFEYWTADGSAQLSDSNGNNIPDTGPIPPSTCTAPSVVLDDDISDPSLGITLECNQTLIRFVAKLPSNVASSPTPFDAVTTATSYNDVNEDDSVTETLTEITAPTVDIANTLIDKNAPVYNINPDIDLDPVVVAGGFDEADVASVFNVDYGTTVSVPLYIANEGGSGDSFLLRAEGSYDTTAMTWDASLPTGWTVVFKHAGIDTDADGTVDIAGTNDIISATPTIPSGSVFWVTAEVTIPSIPAQVLANSDQDNAINANPTSDTDLDYIISMVVESTTSGALDRKVEAFDVSNSGSIDITPSNLNNQVEKGGRVDYEHTLTNSGNTVEVIELSAANDQTGFTNTIRIDVTGDGLPDIELGNLCNGTYTSPITVEQGDSTTAQIDFTCDSPTDTVPELTLDPGEKVPLLVTVFAPSGAAENTTNITTISAETSDPTVSAEAKDGTKIVEGQVRLLKYADIDTDCDGVPNDDKSFLKVETTLVKPTECIIWKLIAINEGDVEAQNVVITDNLTDFTQFENGGSLAACQNTTDSVTIVQPTALDYPLETDDEGPLCVPSEGVTGAAITASQSGNSVTFEIPTLASGDLVVAHFLVKVE